ncbi:ankyrin repeat-containing protein BDA1 [Eucalyptus grandis]|uniref:ankyrin repeat-containing protein BDA1 n=1 Tax=Eucalyptus grandis TaxID=71139 RepID=UPI00192E991B|nr:ankyrin repeat-containing protein BDA1 [Eucalyptus grandis]
MGKSLAEKEEQEARESMLRLAIEKDDVAKLHKLLVEERALLDHVSKHPFPDTPLHFAAEAGKTQVAMEIAILRPSFARELNPEGYSPMHLALQREQYHTVRALMTLDPELVRVRGQCGFTPLHYVARKEGDNELELLAEFLCACKSSIEDLTSKCETAVHVAVNSHNLKAFKVLFRWLKRVHLTEILDWKDQDGNTVYNIASTKEPQPEIVDLLIGNFKVPLKIYQLIEKKLFRGAPASRPPTGNFPLSQFLSMEPTVFEKFKIWFVLRDESARNIILVLATLIMTITYQAALSPPGGYWQDNSSNSTVVTNSSGIAVEKPHKAGDIILNGSKLYEFTALNSTAFLVSIITIWITAIPLLPHTLPVYLLMLILSDVYCATATIAFPKSDVVAGRLIMTLYMSMLGVVLVVPVILWLNFYKYKIRLQSDATGRRVGDLLELKDRK